MCQVCMHIYIYICTEFSSYGFKSHSGQLSMATPKNFQWWIPKASFIPLQSYDYLKKISIKINMATEEGNGRNETWHRTSIKLD